jgi:ubiquinone/menaquinone biosynthesis C-methylase UbiE
MNFLHFINKTINRFIKSSLLSKLLLVLIILLLTAIIVNTVGHVQDIKRIKEGFEGKDGKQEKYDLRKTPETIYDNLYTDIYDDLTLNILKNDYEIGKITENMNTNKENVLLLDIGSGTGHHVGSLNKLGYKSEGLDISPEMVKNAQNTYPQSKFTQGDALDTMQYQADSFTDIICMYFTIYYMKNKRKFFENCYMWLKPGGTLFLHLVDKHKFDPLLNVSNPISAINLQNYAKNRLTKSVAEFDGFSYKANFSLNDNDTADFDEHFTFNDNGKIRQNSHKLYMPDQKEILSMAKDSGFKLENGINLGEANYTNQYLYVLRKPE